jgi:hypothetical protein
VDWQGQWPTPADYVRAIQDPSTCFDDPILRTARVETDDHGIPDGVTGQSATVFFAHTDEGPSVIRCFNRHLAHGEERYAALARHLDTRPVAAFPTVSWLRHGIQVGGRWWPTLRMERVEGRSLRSQVEDVRRDRAALLDLADRWAATATDLVDAGVAHGDLQQDNVRVSSDGTIRLIDLDSVWAPGTANLPPDEFGHPNFQHPERRRTRHWDRYIDAFPALVVYVSLRSLAEEPEMWEEYHNHENLVFTETDFEFPDGTGLWYRLAASRDLEVRRLTKILRQFCAQSVALETDLPTILRQQALVGGTARSTVRSPVEGGHAWAWWEDRRAGGTSATAADRRGELDTTGAAGWWDATAGSAPPRADPPPPPSGYERAERPDELDKPAESSRPGLVRPPERFDNPYVLLLGLAVLITVIVFQLIHR